MDAVRDDPCWLGIDIGGTKIAAGLTDDAGRLLSRAQTPTPATSGAAAIMDAAAAVATEVLGDRRLAGAGIGAAGVISDGRVAAATDLLPGWTGTDLAGSLRARLHLGTEQPVVAVNDVHAHAAGEARLGAGADCDLVLLIAIGTGLGGAIVYRGTPLIGRNGVGGHLGHIHSPDAAGLRCSCGATGHLEAVASGYGLLRIYRAAGGDPEVADARAIAERTGTDQQARSAVLRSAGALGRALGDLLSTLDPDMVILSGSVSGAGDLWWDEVRSAAGNTAIPALTRTPIVPAALGENAGIVGAARLARDQAVAATPAPDPAGPTTETPTTGTMS